MAFLQNHKIFEELLMSASKIPITKNDNKWILFNQKEFCDGI